MNVKKTSVYLILLFIFFVKSATFVLADCSNTNQNGNTVSLSDPLCINNVSLTPQTLIGKVIAAALGIVGSLALLMFIYGGFTWMTSAGSAEKVTKGKGIMVWAALGLVVIFSSYALVKFVIEGVTK